MNRIKPFRFELSSAAHVTARHIQDFCCMGTHRHALTDKLLTSLLTFQEIDYHRTMSHIQMFDSTVVTILPWSPTKHDKGLGQCVCHL